METLKCALSLAALARIWNHEGVTDDNRFFFFLVVFLFQSLLLSLKILEDTKKIDKIILLIWNYHFIDYVIVFTGVRCY